MDRAPRHVTDQSNQGSDVVSELADTVACRHNQLFLERAELSWQLLVFQRVQS